MRTPRPLPLYDAESRPFWTGGEHSQLLIHRCADCMAWHHPPRPVCYKCHSWNVAPTPASGRGEIVSFTINHQAWLPGMQVPFVIAYVRIEEASEVWLMSNVVNCPVDAVFIGQKVRVVFEQQEEVWIPLFEPESLQ